MKCLFEHQDLKMFGLKLNKYMKNFHPLEVVSRCSETQLQVVEHLNKIAWWEKCCGNATLHF